MLKEINPNDFSWDNYKISITPFTKILVYETDKIVAFLDYSVMYEKIEINYIYVLEEYRNKKIAYKLLKYILDNYKFDNITLEVRIDNEYAIKLYRSLGFKIINKREKYYQGIDAYLMEVKYEDIGN